MIARVDTVRSRSRRRLGPAERKASIGEASAEVFARRGFEATSMADISAAAGVSHLIVYRHFESKAALYQSVLQRAVTHLDHALAGDDAVGDLGPTPATLLAAARADEAAFCALWRHAAREPQFSSTTEAARELLVERTRAALGAAVPAENARWAARATVAYVLEAVLVWVEDGAEDLDLRWLAATEAGLRAGVEVWSDTALDADEGEH